MKKLILLLVCTCLLLSGCSVFPQTTGEVDENSVLTPSVASTEEGDDTLKATVKVFEFDGKTVSARYLKTGQRSTGGYYDEYEDDAGTVYTFDIDGNLIGYYPKSDQKNSTEKRKLIDEQDAKNIAAEYAKNFLGETYDKLQQSSYMYDEATQVHSVGFATMYKSEIKGVTCTVRLNEFGEILSVNSPNLEKLKSFDESLLEEFDISEFRKNVRTLAREKYKNYTSLETTSLQIINSDGKYMVQVFAWVSVPNGPDGTEMSYEMEYSCPL